MQPYLVVLFVFLAIFTQSVSGFGLALVSMPLLADLLGIQVATPLVALIAITAETLLVLRFRRDLRFDVIWRLVAGAVAGIPAGLLLLRYVPEEAAMIALGVLVIAYALYALRDSRLPALTHPAWPYGMGFLAGMLGSAYNISGPPVIVYGHCQRWPPAEFKGNLQGFFVGISAAVALGHAWAGNLTAAVWQNYLWSLAGIGLGVGLGALLDRFINPVLFRRLVLWLLIGLGLRLVF